MGKSEDVCFFVDFVWWGRRECFPLACEKINRYEERIWKVVDGYS